MAKRTPSVYEGMTDKQLHELRSKKVLAAYRIRGINSYWGGKDLRRLETQIGAIDAELAYRLSRMPLL
jgi:hypothetical protein